MTPRRFIPALSTLGVIAGLAAARMVFEVVPFGRAAEAVSAWVHEGPGPAAKPSVVPSVMPSLAAKRPVPVPGVRVRMIDITAAVPEPARGPGEFEDDGSPGHTPAVPMITNSESPAVQWIGA